MEQNRAFLLSMLKYGSITFVGGGEVITGLTSDSDSVKIFPLPIPRAAIVKVCYLQNFAKVSIRGHQISSNKSKNYD